MNKVPSQTLTNMNNKTNKGNKMKKIAMILGILSIFATNANAGYWVHTPSFGDNPRGDTSTQWNSVYTY